MAQVDNNCKVVVCVAWELSGPESSKASEASSSQPMT